MLILIGAESTDDLGQYGLPIAERYEKADSVVLVTKTGKGYPVKFGRDQFHSNIEAIYLEDDLNSLRMIVAKIVLAHRTAHPESKDLSRQFVSVWMFDMNSSDGQPKLNYELFDRRHLDILRKSADEFIERDFGMGDPGTLNSDGTRINSSPARISSHDGEGDDLRADS